MASPTLLYMPTAAATMPKLICPAQKVNSTLSYLVSPKFHHYLVGAKFTLMIDNAALTNLESSCGKNSKLTHLAMVLENCDFQVKFYPGASITNANSISYTNQPPTSPADHLPILQVSLPFSIYSVSEPLDLPITCHIVEIAAMTPDIDTSYSINQLHGLHQLLLEAAPCSFCCLPISAYSSTSILRDSCNQVFHLGCIHLTSAPHTYFYCPPYCHHLAYRGFHKPSEDIDFH